MSVDFYKEFGPLGYLANYSDYGFYKDGIYYKTVEHFYQAAKFDDPDIKSQIINANTPKEASNIGRDRNNKRIDNFKNIKNEVMAEGIYLKFMNNPEIRAKLIETRNQDIREMTTKEYYWGVGDNLSGENHIGKILCAVREMLKKNLIENLISSNIGKRVYVIGHSNPDADAVFSAIVLTNILKNYGIDAVFAVRDENFVDKKLISDYLSDEYEVINNYEDKLFILVDHNNLLSIPKENVLFSIDHHPITGEVDDLIEIEYSSCALLIYDLFKDKYEFSDKEKTYIALSVLSDTEYLTSPRFTSDDKILYDSLNTNFNAEEMRKLYFKTTDYDLSYEFNFKENYKQYEFHNSTISRTILTGNGCDKNIYYDLYVSSMKKFNIDLLIFCDYENKKTYVHFQNLDFVMPYFTSSTYLILKYIDDNQNIKTYNKNI